MYVCYNYTANDFSYKDYFEIELTKQFSDNFFFFQEIIFVWVLNRWPLGLFHFTLIHQTNYNIKSKKS